MAAGPKEQPRAAASGYDCFNAITKFPEFAKPMSSTPVSSVVLFIVAAILGAVGQFLYKAGADLATGGPITYIANLRIIGGVICYTAVMVLFVAAFKRGGSLAVLYPIYASTFIWAALIARVAYIRAIGASVGAGQIFVGPMAKPQRMALLSAVAALGVVLPDAWMNAGGVGVLNVALWIIVAGGLITVVRRLRRTAIYLEQSRGTPQ